LEEFQRRLVFVGIGGQGVILVARIMGAAATKAGYTVMGAETRGNAVRGGTALAHMGYGIRRVFSPLTMKGTADAVVGFEPMEALRMLPYLSPRRGVVVYNTEPVIPVPARIRPEYPELEELQKVIAECSPRAIPLDAAAIAKKAGTSKASNTVLLGALSAALDLRIPEETLLEALLATVPPGTEGLNTRAFELGKEAVGGKA